MPARTLVGSDDGGRNLWRLVGVAAAGYTIYRVASGKKTGPLAVISAVVTLASFWKGLS
jgi:hypothetical protein